MNDRHVLVGVSGGIAAYKSAMLVSQLVQAGAQVQVILTAAAREFIGAATFAALTGRPVPSEVFDPNAYPLGAHITLAEQAELLCVAPATASVIAKTAHGLADDLLSTTLLSFTGKVVFAPAMNCEMWEKPAVQRNVDQLRKDGITIVDPEVGWLSCRKQGAGRMAPPERIFAAIADLLNVP